MAFPSYTYTFSNSTTADASQVNQNFTDILNGISDTTKDISIAALTAAGVSTLNGNVVLGISSVKTVTFNGSLSSSIPISANTSWDFGSATLGLKSVYIGGTSTFTTRIMSAATASWTLNLPVTAGSASQFLQTDGSGNTSWASAQNGAMAVASKSTTYTVLTTDDLVLLSGASFTVTLYTAVGNTGKVVRLQHGGTSFSQVYTLATTSAQTIGGIASGSYALYTNGETLVLVSDGSNWQILDHKTTTAAVAYTPTLTNFGGSPLPTVIISTWSRSGDRIKIQGIVTFSSGAISGVQAVSFPTGVTSDSTKMSTTNYMSIGTAAQSGQSVGILPIAEGNQTTFGFGIASTAQLTPGSVAVSSTNISWSIEFAVSGWQP